MPTDHRARSGRTGPSPVPDPRCPGGHRMKIKKRLTGESAAPSYTPTIALRSVDGHLVRTRTQVWAWYRLAPQRWSFRSDSARNNLIVTIAGQYAELAGRWLHLRVTSSAYPIAHWARAHVDNAHHRPDDVPGG